LFAAAIVDDICPGFEMPSELIRNWLTPAVSKNINVANYLNIIGIL
jgi:hypothetical protein